MKNKILLIVLMITMTFSAVCVFAKSDNETKLNELQEKLANYEEFEYDPDTDPAFQQASKKLTNQIMESMNARGILGSTITGSNVSEGVANMLPQYQNAAYSRYQDNINNLINQINIYEYLVATEKQRELDKEKLSQLSQTNTNVVSVDGYFRKDGTYVTPYVRTAPDNTTSNNFSTKGNINPYTGEEGTKKDANASNTSAQNSYTNNRNFLIFSSPYNFNGNNLVSIREISNELKLHLNWKSSTNTATLYNDNAILVIAMQLNNPNATIEKSSEESATTKLIICPVIKNGKLYVPLRFVLENFGYSINNVSENSNVLVVTVTK